MTWSEPAGGIGPRVIFGRLPDPPRPGPTTTPPPAPPTAITTDPPSPPTCTMPTAGPRPVLQPLPPKVDTRPPGLRLADGPAGPPDPEQPASSPAAAIPATMLASAGRHRRRNEVAGAGQAPSGQRRPCRRSTAGAGWLAAERIGGLDAAGAERGVQAGQQADDRAGRGGGQHDARVNQGGPVLVDRDRERGQHAQAGPEQPAEQAERGRLGQELNRDVPGAGAESPAQADLP